MNKTDLEQLRNRVANGDAIMSRIEALKEITARLAADIAFTVELQPDAVVIKADGNQVLNQAIDGELYWAIYEAIQDGLKKVQTDQSKELKRL